MGSEARPRWAKQGSSSAPGLSPLKEAKARQKQKQKEGKSKSKCKAAACLVCLLSKKQKRSLQPSPAARQARILWQAAQNKQGCAESFIKWGCKEKYCKSFVFLPNLPFYHFPPRKLGHYWLKQIFHHNYCICSLIPSFFCPVLEPFRGTFNAVSIAVDTEVRLTPREWNFSFPFLFPKIGNRFLKFGNGLSNSRPQGPKAIPAHPYSRYAKESPDQV